MDANIAKFVVKFGLDLDIIRTAGVCNSYRVTDVSPRLRYTEGVSVTVTVLVAL